MPCYLWNKNDTASLPKCLKMLLRLDRLQDSSGSDWCLVTFCIGGRFAVVQPNTKMGAVESESSFSYYWPRALLTGVVCVV